MKIYRFVYFTVLTIKGLFLIFSFGLYLGTNLCALFFNGTTFCCHQKVGVTRDQTLGI